MNLVSKLPISVCIITKDEEEKLPACLESVRGWVDDIVVVDSLSTDGTVDIARAFGARVFWRPFTDFADQKNYAVSQAQNDWVLVLDADERAEPGLWDAIAQRYHKGDFQRYAAFCFPFWTIHEDGQFHLWVAHYPVFGFRLYDRRRCTHVGQVHEGVEIRGSFGFIPRHIIHEPHRGLARLQAKLDLYHHLEGKRGIRPALIARPRKGWRLALGNAWFYFKAMFVDLGFWRKGPRYWVFILQWFAYRYIPAVRPLAGKERWAREYLRRNQGSTL